MLHRLKQFSDSPLIQDRESWISIKSLIIEIHLAETSIKLYIVYFRPAHPPSRGESGCGW